MQIVWSDDAVADYHQNIDFLLDKWSVQVAVEFMEDVETIIELVERQPEIYPLTDYQGIRKAEELPSNNRLFNNFFQPQFVSFW